MPSLVGRPNLISGSKKVHAGSSFLLLCVLITPTLWLALCLFCMHPSRSAIALELSIVLGFLCICQRSCCRFAAALLPLFWRETCSLGLSVGGGSNNRTCMCILNRCNTLSVESQLQSKGLRWLGHIFWIFRPKRLLFGDIKRLCPPDRPGSSLNDVAIRDCQNCRISRPYKDAQDRLLWRDKTCPAHT